MLINSVTSNDHHFTWASDRNNHCVLVEFLVLLAWHNFRTRHFYCRPYNRNGTFFQNLSIEVIRLVNDTIVDASTTRIQSFYFPFNINETVAHYGLFLSVVKAEARLAVIGAVMLLGIDNSLYQLEFFSILCSSRFNQIFY